MHSAVSLVDNDPPADGVENSQGVISLLQKYVQCSKEFRAPTRRSILQWSFEERTDDPATMGFRATVAFVLDGVPHHSVGDWRRSKQQSKQDAAERALVLFVNCWGEQLLQTPEHLVEIRVARQAEAQNSDRIQEIQILDEFCGRFPCPPPTWHVSWDANKCQAFAEINLMGVPHHFGGAICDNEKSAYVDTAKRTLWYLNSPGFGDSFEPDPEALAARSRDIPAPPQNWLNKDAVKESAGNRSERTRKVKAHRQAAAGWQQARH